MISEVAGDLLLPKALLQLLLLPFAHVAVHQHFHYAQHRHHNYNDVGLARNNYLATTIKGMLLAFCKLDQLSNFVYHLHVWHLIYFYSSSSAP